MFAFLVLAPPALKDFATLPQRATVLVPVLTLLAMNAIMVQAAPLPESVSADPAEDMFLAAAVAVDCIMIISGDAHLLDDSGWRGIAILTPRQFVDPYLSTT